MNTRITLAACAALLALQAPAFAKQETAPIDKKARYQAWEVEKAALEKALVPGHTRADYRAQLEKAGYWITSVNRDATGGTEWEIVKGPNTYEVQLNYDKSGKADKVTVSPNVWKAASTRAAMTRADYKYVYPSKVSRDAKTASDSARHKAWLDEKGRMEAQLGIGHPVSHYAPALKKMGYTVSSVNDKDPTHVEYEVVRGDTSYEVQINFDKATGKSTKLDVTTNLWDAPGTDRAKGQK